MLIDMYILKYFLLLYSFLEKDQRRKVSIAGQMKSIVTVNFHALNLAYKFNLKYFLIL